MDTKIFKKMQNEKQMIQLMAYFVLFFFQNWRQRNEEMKAESNAINIDSITFYWMI